MLAQTFEACARACCRRSWERGLALARPELPPPLDTAPVTLSCASGDVVAYADDGARDSRDVFVAIHGAPGSARDWRYLARVLAKGARVIRLELPGNGSAPPWDEAAMEASPPDSARFARTVVEACDKLDLWSKKVLDVTPPMLPLADRSDPLRAALRSLSC